MAEGQITTLKGTAIAIVALARFIASENGALAASLARDLQNAETAGMEAADLELLRVVINAASACAGQTPQKGRSATLSPSGKFDH